MTKQIGEKWMTYRGIAGDNFRTGPIGVGMVLPFNPSPHDSVKLLEVVHTEKGDWWKTEDSYGEIIWASDHILTKRVTA